MEGLSRAIQGIGEALSDLSFPLVDRRSMSDANLFEHRVGSREVERFREIVVARSNEVVESCCDVGE